MASEFDAPLFHRQFSRDVIQRPPGSGRMIRNDVPSFCPRGLLALILRTVQVRHSREDGHYENYITLDGRPVHMLEVTIGIIVPDRDSGEWREIMFSGAFMPEDRHVHGMGLSVDESCLIQALETMWTHELEEGFTINGREVLDPDKLHDGRSA